jgi:hypothetical protein
MQRAFLQASAAQTTSRIKIGSMSPDFASPRRFSTGCCGLRLLATGATLPFLTRAAPAHFLVALNVFNDCYSRTRPGGAINFHRMEPKRTKIVSRPAVSAMLTGDYDERREYWLDRGNIYWRVGWLDRFQLHEE